MPPKKRQSSKKKKKVSSAKAMTAPQVASGDGGRSNSPPVMVPVPNQQLPAKEMVLDTLVGKLWPNFVPESMSSDAESLRRYLKTVLFGVAADAKHFFLPALCSFLIEALYSGQMDSRMTPDPTAEPFYLLMWVCQWKFSHEQFGFRGDDDLVEIVLKLGANVNDRMEIGTNALFFAVKYGSIRTVNLLLNAGVDIWAVDHVGRTCLRNALEHPQLDILERLLQTLPATEVFLGEPNLSAADELLKNFICQVQDGDIKRVMPISWLVLGRPTVDNIARALVLVLRKGSEFTNTEFLSYAFSGFEPVPGIAQYEHLKESSRQMKIIGSLLSGKWLPDQLRQEVAEFDLKTLSLRENTALETAKNGCAICLSSNEEDGNPREKIELYCGHCFCLDCIVDYGKRQASRAWCPICQRPLCLELCSSIPSGRRSGIELLRFDPSPLAGPFVMNEEQVLQECCARNISVSGKALGELRCELVVPQITSMEAELCATVTISDGSNVVLAPKDGLVVIPIVIKSIPVLACVSSRSPCTVVSSDFAAAFGLKKKNLKTNKFTDFGGRRYKNLVYTALHEFELTIGGITVQLDSAVETSKLPAGIQLGLDFLSSATYCIFEVEISGDTCDAKKRTFMRLDNRGGLEILRNVTASKKEEMRYYSKSGEAFVTKVHRIQHSKNYVLTCGLRTTATLDECNWCCKLFPVGMKKCPKCPGELFYCDKDCQTKAWPVHRLKPAHSSN